MTFFRQAVRKTGSVCHLVHVLQQTCRANVRVHVAVFLPNSDLEERVLPLSSRLRSKLLLTVSLISTLRLRTFVTRLQIKPVTCRTLLNIHQPHMKSMTSLHQRSSGKYSIRCCDLKIAVQAGPFAKFTSRHAISLNTYRCASEVLDPTKSCTHISRHTCITAIASINT